MIKHLLFFFFCLLFWAIRSLVFRGITELGYWCLMLSEADTEPHVAQARNQVARVFVVAAIGGDLSLSLSLFMMA